MTVLDQAKAIRAAMDGAGSILTDEQARTCVPLYRDFDSLLGTTVAAGCRFRLGSRLYKTLQEAYTFRPDQRPGDAGLESLFARLDETHAGTPADPIPYEGNMELLEGLIYSQEGSLYRCVRDTGAPVYHKLKDLLGIYVEAAV